MEGGKNFDQLPAAEKPEEGEGKTTRVCSWCGREFGEKGEVMASGSSKTHGICPTCTTEKKEEIEIDRKEREKIEERPVRYCSSCGAKIGERIICGVCGAKN